MMMMKFNEQIKRTKSARKQSVLTLIATVIEKRKSRSPQAFTFCI